MSSVWGGGAGEIYSEEFPFENLNNMTSDNWLTFLKGDSGRKYLGRGGRLSLWGVGINLE